MDGIDRYFDLTAAGTEGTVTDMKTTVLKAIGRQAKTADATRSMALTCIELAEAAMKAGDLSFSIEAAQDSYGTF